jgi:hypothetical protein
LGGGRAIRREAGCKSTAELLLLCGNANTVVVIYKDSKIRNIADVLPSNQGAVANERVERRYTEASPIYSAEKTETSCLTDTTAMTRILGLCPNYFSTVDVVFESTGNLLISFSANRLKERVSGLPA